MRLAILLVASSATLTACATSGAEPSSLTAPAADPVIETRTIVRLTCPDEIWRPLPEEPTPAPDAEVTWNDAGGLWIDGKFERGDAALDALESAQAACRAAGAAPP
ncbi:MAG: hypothetical protein ACK4RV_11730 [Caulobacter sp.]